MTVFLKEYFRPQQKNVKIDKDAGIIYGVKILGNMSRNNRRYPIATLRDAVTLYENAKVNLDHPEGDPRQNRSYQDRFGMIKNVRLDESEGLYADFHYNTKHPLAEQLLWDAENAPENVGFSHNVEAHIEKEDEFDVVTQIVSVRSVDLVADPATTHGLFESISAESEKELSKAKSRIRVLESVLRYVEKASREISSPISELLSKPFLETVFANCDEQKVHSILEDRASLIKRLQSKSETPICREQITPQISEAGINGFLRSIKN